MKTAVSIPDPIFRSAERTAKRLRMSRSRFYARALDAFLKAQETKRIQKALNDLYNREDSSMDPLLREAVEQSFSNVEWEE